MSRAQRAAATAGSILTGGMPGSAELPSAAASPVRLWRVETHSPQETQALGRLLGRFAPPDCVIALSGPLGAGKTVLAQGIGQGLQTSALVRSSSFVLVTAHPGGRLPLLHADLYRLSAPEEIAELALEEEAAGGVLVVEWPERWAGGLPPDRLTVLFEEGTASSHRVLTFVAQEPVACTLLEQIQRAARPAAEAEAF